MEKKSEEMPDAEVVEDPKAEPLTSESDRPDTITRGDESPRELLKKALDERGELEDGSDPLPPEDDDEEELPPTDPPEQQDGDDKGQGDREETPEDPESDTPVKTPVRKDADTSPQTGLDKDDIRYVEGATIEPELWKDLPADAKKVYHSLRDAVVEARHEREVAQFEKDALQHPAKTGQVVEKFMADNGITSKGAEEWWTVGALVNARDPRAVPILQNYLQQIGGDLPTHPDARIPAAGTQSTKLDELHKSGIITDAEYRDLQAELAPATQQPLPQFQAPGAAEPQTQNAGPDPYEAANQRLSALNEQWAEKHGIDWFKTLQPQLKAELDRFQGAPPDQWEKLARQSYQLVIARNRATLTKKRGRASSVGGNSAPPQRGQGDVSTDLKGRARLKELARRGQL